MSTVTSPGPGSSMTMSSTFQSWFVPQRTAARVCVGIGSPCGSTRGDVGVDGTRPPSSTPVRWRLPSSHRSTRPAATTWERATMDALTIDTETDGDVEQAVTDGTTDDAALVED